MTEQLVPEPHFAATISENNITLGDSFRLDIVSVNNGDYADIHIVSVIGSTQGIDFIKSHFPEHTHLWIAAIDDELDSKGYIVPGLGDAGDLAFGSKL